MSQKEIDALLGTSIEEEDESEFSDTDHMEPDESERKNKTSFKGFVKTNIITVPYVSPVLKSEELLIDPEGNTDGEYANVPVVRTILNYKRYKKFNGK